MKRLVTLLVVIGFLFCPLLSDEKETMDKAIQLYKQGEFDKALTMLDEAIKATGLTNNFFGLKFSILMKQEKMDDAAALVENALKTLGENPQILSYKLYVLSRQGKFEEALTVALRKEELLTKKNPYDTMDVAEAYMKLKNVDKAFEWLEKAIERGFNSLESLLEDETFKPLTEDPRFEKIKTMIKDKIGIDKAAKDFTVTLLNGETFQLSKQVGKVVLIDFWATWCGPCRAEMPNIKQTYQSFKDKGFEIIGISLDREEAKLKEYIEKEQLGWKISYSGKFWDDDTARFYGINSIPSYWLVDKKGVLRYFDLRGEALKKAVEALLAEK